MVSTGLVMALALEDVLGDVDEHGAGAAGGGDVERFVDDLRQVLERFTRKLCLVHGAGDAEGVGFLEGVAADQLGGAPGR